MRLTPDAKPDDGILDLLFIHDMGAIKRLLNFPKIYSGKHISSSAFSVRRCKKLTVSSEERVPVSADGEVIGRLPCTIELIPHALKVRCTI
jgi:diacylglycerol kinase (ATP)